MAEGPTASEWRLTGIERCRSALRSASALGDRLALLRSLARLLDGRLDLAAEAINVSDSETHSLRRFGLGLSGRTLRILDEQSDVAPLGFWEAERLDTASRKISSDAPPDAALIRHTGFTRYRMPAQKAGVRAVSTMPPGSGLMVSMPTGSGKSLLFQLEAIRWRNVDSGSCIAVITPTVSLALDHTRGLAAFRGLESSGALIGGGGAVERFDLLNAFRRGEVPLLFLSPEYALGAARPALLEAAKPREQKLAALGARLQMVVLDEAHIIESWGRSFRPDFQRLPALVAELRQHNPDLKVLLLSATLPPAARDVLRQAYATIGDWLEVDAHAPRYEFDVVVQSYTDGQERLAALDFVIDRAPRPAIVYTTLVDPTGDPLRVSAQEIHARLKSRGYERIALFTGNIGDLTERHRIVNDWANEKLDLVVATSAFGMGVDKPNVRTVIHACLPEGGARWYQEIGRASRDGHQGLTVCLFTNGAEVTGAEWDDVSDAYGNTIGSWLTREVAEKRWHALLKKAATSDWGASGYRRVTLDLDATRVGLDPRRSTDYNRTWNMSLLNLMQRAGVLEIVSGTVEEDTAGTSWDVEIKDPALLADGNTEVWNRIFKVRDQEKADARTELKRFERLMKHPTETCLIRGVFDLIEDDAPYDLPDCGRCPSCRLNGRRPPERFTSRGAEAVWRCHADQGSCELLTGMTLITPHDPTHETGFDLLISRLATCGLEQFVVPDHLTQRTAQTVAGLSKRFGFVSGSSEILDRHAASLACLHTGFVLPDDDRTAEALLHRARHHSTTAPMLSVAIVADPSRKFRGRRLDQTESRFPPYSEGFLDTLTSRTEVV